MCVSEGQIEVNVTVYSDVSEEQGERSFTLNTYVCTRYRLRETLLRKMTCV